MDSYYVVISSLEDFIDDVNYNGSVDRRIYNRRKAEDLLAILQRLPTQFNLNQIAEKIDDVADEIHDLDHSSQAYELQSIANSIRNFNK